LGIIYLPKVGVAKGSIENLAHYSKLVPKLFVQPEKLAAMYFHENNQKIPNG
jgi:hypothetical protein